MKQIQTTQELMEWIADAQSMGYRVPIVLNGGGFSWIEPGQDAPGTCTEDGIISIADDEEYADDVEYLEKGEEYEDFRDILSPEEYDAMTFVLVSHDSGYNKENNDLQVGIYDIDEISSKWE